MSTHSNAHLVILEHPVEKFRFRYKSEMHGTHGSLTGNRSMKSKKTFPEVELKNCNQSGIIRCSLYQTDTNKALLHSHLLVVHKEDKEVSDPHDVEVSPELGYIVRFENMGIIHTAKKDVSKELLKKKINKLKFELQCNESEQTSLQISALRDETDREAKLINLNKVCLCFEAFRIVDGGRYEKICEPVFSNPINNLKSAMTGELKICRLSMYTGSVEGNDDLILLVEKVTKNNIKVRFFEILNDEEVWEKFGSFTEADVHHQYAIVVRTPPYRDKEIDNHVNVFIELVRESDNKRSDPVQFRYKPKNIVLARKRRRTSNSSSNFTPSSINSFELPESIHKLKLEPQVTSESGYEASSLYDSFADTNESIYQLFMQQVDIDSEKLENILKSPLLCDRDIDIWGYDQVDGEATVERTRPENKSAFHLAIKLLVSTFNECSKIGFENAIKRFQLIFNNYAAQNDNAETIVHDVVKQCNKKYAAFIFKIILKFHLSNLLSQTNNNRQTPLHVACMFDQAAYVERLVSLKCDPNIQDTNGNTALHIVAAENLLQCMQALVSSISSSNINVNLANNDGMTPLHLAIRNNNLECVKILLVKCNASVKISNSRDGNNALHLAVQQQSPEIVSLILENSASSHLNVKNQAGHTVVDLAKTLKEPQREKILTLLRENLPATTFLKDESDIDESTSSTGDGDDDDEVPITIDQEQELLIRNKIQKDPTLCKSLAKVLSTDQKWQKLAKQLHLDHLLCIWPNAESMLKCVVGVENIKLLNLRNALQAVDKEAANILSSFLTQNIRNF